MLFNIINYYPRGSRQVKDNISLFIGYLPSFWILITHIFVGNLQNIQINTLHNGFLTI